MTPRRKKLAITLASIAVVVIATLALIPLLFKGRIAERARLAIESAVDAQVNWSGLGLTFFRDFPHLTLGLENLSVVGVDEFEGDTLAAMRRFRLVLNAGSVVRTLLGGGPVEIRSIRLEEPAVLLRVLEDGTANWDIMRPREAAPDTGGRALAVELQSLEVSDARFVFENEQTGVFASLEGLDHVLRGNFSRDSLGIRSRTHADRATVRFAGTPYLAGVRLDFDANIDADLANQRFAFNENELRLNELAVRFEGTAARANDALALDVSFNTPGTSFGEILSLVPAVYAQDFASLETSGTFSLDGYVRGTYSETAFPAFALEADVADGMFRYPDLPLPARDIALDLSIVNPGGSADSTVVDLRRLHVAIGDQPIEAAFTLRTPVSDPAVAGRVQGRLDLADLGRTVKLENVEQLTGTVAANATVGARRSDLEAERWDQVRADGTIEARGVAVAAENLRQPVAIEEAVLRLSPRQAALETFRATLGSSDLTVTGHIDDVLGSVLRDQPIRGTVTFTSQRFVLDEWKSDEPGLEVIPVPAGLDLLLNGTIERLHYGQLEMADARGSVRIRDQRLTIEDFGFETLGGRIALSGFYETVDLARPAFGIDLAIDSVDIRQAAETLLTVRTLAPVASYARGSFSADLDLNGALSSNLTPLFDVLTGSGSLLTSRIALEDFPPMQRLAETIGIPRLAEPALAALRSTISIRDGRLHVQPFRIGVGDFALQVSGSNGIDRSLDYDIELIAPRAVLGDAADRLISGLTERAGRAGLNLAAADTLRIGAKLTGTVNDPAVQLGEGDVAGSVGEQAQGAAGQALQQGEEAARERVDSAREEARRRARARADSIVARAEEQADSIRAEARRRADDIRAEGDRRAEQVLARATNEIARRAAQPVADRIRREANEQADALVREADERADQLVAEARRRADDIVGDTTGGG